MGLREKYRAKPLNRYQPIQTQEGDLTNETQEEMQRWAGWLTTQFSQPEQQLIPEMEHVTENNGMNSNNKY